MISIYTDKETDKLIEQLKEENDGFNASAIFKSALKELGGSSNTIDIDEINHKLSQTHLEREKIDVKINYLQKKQSQFLLNQKKSQHQKESDIKDLILKIKQYYEVTNKEALEYSEEYVNKDLTCSITSFLDKKGAKMKK
jgi:hypothetical protein|tara:strand:+ start:63 stop:482 length:420 start_codon:yes stop_codon:yes gene_type:complete